LFWICWTFCIILLHRIQSFHFLRIW
jgi:hypothetical protein